jgi:peptidoglycan-associated lipoprotein
MRGLLGFVVIVVFAVGCSTSGTTTPSDGDGKDDGFGPEGGMSERSAPSGGAEASHGELRTIYFDYDQYGLKTGAKQDLQHNADLLSKRGDSRVEIQGNCDERGTEEYNLALGKKRAEAARRYLIDLGVKSSRITTISFGEENPVVRGQNESAWAKNRRDDFVLR